MEHHFVEKQQILEANTQKYEDYNHKINMLNEELRLKDEEHQTLIGEINNLTMQLGEMKRKNEASISNLENIVTTLEQ